jgi:hypothetical protein
MFVFGEVQDPNPDTVNLVEDIVRSQIIELVSIVFATSRDPDSQDSRLLDCPSARPRYSS